MEVLAKVLIESAATKVAEEGVGGIPGAAAENEGEGKGKEKGGGEGGRKGGLVGVPTAMGRLSRRKADGSGKSREQQVGLSSDYEIAILIANSYL